MKPRLTKSQEDHSIRIAQERDEITGEKQIAIYVPWKSKRKAGRKVCEGVEMNNSNPDRAERGDAQLQGEEMNKPNPGQMEALRVRVAKLCGKCPHLEIERWSIEDGNAYDWGYTCKKCGADPHSGSSKLPNYPEDLNACHEAEGMLATREMRAQYEDALDEVVSILPEEGATGSVIDLVMAEAWQRCVALDRTLSETPIL